MSSKKTNEKVKSNKNKTSSKSPPKIELNNTKKELKSEMNRKNTFPSKKVEKLILKNLKPKDYLPDIKKRNVSTNKIKLKFKPNLKPINKRKGCPKQSVDYIEERLRGSLIKFKNSHDKCKDFTISETVQAMEMADVLTDEDFMDILTCPSPVWWENDENLNQDREINSGSEKNCNAQPEEPKIQEKTNEKEATEKSMDIIVENPLMLPQITEEKFEQIFLEKRLSLENLLSSMKKNGSKNNRDGNSKSTDESDIEDGYEEITDIEIIPKISDLFNLKNNFDTDTEKHTNEPEITEKTHKKSSEILEDDEKMYNAKNKLNENIYSDTSKQNSRLSSPMEIDDLNTSIVNEEMLNDLENISIPIEKTNEEKSKKQDEMIECVVLDEVIAAKEPCCSKSIKIDKPTVKKPKKMPSKKNKSVNINNENNTSVEAHKSGEYFNSDIINKYVDILKNKMLVKKSFLSVPDDENYNITDNIENSNKNEINSLDNNNKESNYECLKT